MVLSILITLNALSASYTKRLHRETVNDAVGQSFAMKLSPIVLLRVYYARDL